MRVLMAMVAALAALHQRPSTPLVPRFEGGEAQPVFAGDEVLRHNVWVPNANLDTDRDGEWDRIRLQVHRPAATDQGTLLPVVLLASPYFGGTLPYPRHDVEVPLFVPGRAWLERFHRSSDLPPLSARC